MTASVQADRVAALMDPAGRLTMVALDHRESLRIMMSTPAGPPTPERARAFRRAAISALAPVASALLLDVATVHDAPARALVPADTALVLAADTFDQPPGEPVRSSRLDPAIDVATIRCSGAAALKILVLWQSDIAAGERAEQVGPFVELARAAGVASLVEGIVRPPGGRDWTSPRERHEAILTAAAELCAFRPDVYKAEIPGYVDGDLSLVRRESERLSAIVARPWVVLSNGVRTEEFVPGLAEACAGGAHGFLAGRAVWGDVAKSPDPQADLASVSVPRLRSMIEVAHRAAGVGG